METIESLTAIIDAATRDLARGRLQYRGTAWSLMRVNGVLPSDAPALGGTIETDLEDYGFSVLRAAMALRELDAATESAGDGFKAAASAFEAVVRNGDPESPKRGFLRTIAAAAYHLAGQSAVAYSLFNQSQGNGLNTSPGETAVMYLILRDLDRLRSFVRDWLTDEGNSDTAIAATLESDADSDESDDDKDTADAFDASIASILNSTICRAMAFFDFALETGRREPLDRALELLGDGISLSSNSGNVPLWWVTKLCRHLISDLWDHSLHEVLPKLPGDGPESTSPDLRELFIGSLYARKVSEVELWPSQRVAAKRCADLSDDLVVALPTSAGKTRVAEIAALMTLGAGRRVLIVTPLRALSAQTERSFRKTFAPLGFTVSSLYGASGLSSGDEDALRSRQIVISTPEKLDFALRSDPSLIDDVGLIVLDEGHMIGPTEREIRYEILVQRLLRRSDAADRRIVCLSAVLPEGKQLDDLTGWIRSDVPGEAVHTRWRPTGQRFGMLTWNAPRARLSLDLSGTGPFINGFVQQVAPRGKERKPYPRGAKDLTLFAAWEFAGQGKRTLIYCTQANWVEGYGEQAINLCKRGYLKSLVDDETAIERALAVGREWLGNDHSAVSCLKAGIAVHHGKLPSPFLRELELLLSEGAVKVIVASPTLSQGLNLNAAVLLIPALVRSGQPISGEEFANVAGRAGRAFVDVEGLVVHTMFDKVEWRLAEWRKLVQVSKERELRSGLILLVIEILERLTENGVLARPDAWEYLASSRSAWVSDDESDAAAAEDADEDADEDGDSDSEPAREPLSQLVERLDAAVFGLVEALDSDSTELPRLLDEALNGSLWERQIVRERDGTNELHRELLASRAALIWSHTTTVTRKGHFAMGVGLEAGLAIDEMADELGKLIDQADDAALTGDVDQLAASLAALASHLLVVRPFVPDKKNSLPPNWKTILKKWIAGTDVAVIGPDHMRVIEDAFMYRLTWALEAVRMRRVTNGWESSLIPGGAAATLETGVPRFMMAMLIRAGLPSRKAAIAAIEATSAAFVTPAEMRSWLESDEVASQSEQDGWPTAETVELWRRFRSDALSNVARKWNSETLSRTLELEAERPSKGLYRILPDGDDEGRTWLATPDFELVAPFRRAARNVGSGILWGEAEGGSRLVVVHRLGEGKVNWPVDRLARN